MSPESIKNALELYRAIRDEIDIPIPSVSASADGEAALSWDNERWGISVYIMADGTYEWSALSEDDQQFHEGGSENLAEALQFIRGHM